MDLHNLFKMKKNIKDFVKGWFIGDFEPTILKTKDFEVGIKEYDAGIIEEKHFHKEAVEFTIVLDGIIRMNGIEYYRNDIIQVDKNEINQFESITTSRLLVIKTPSVNNDKYIV